MFNHEINICVALLLSLLPALHAVNTTAKVIPIKWTAPEVLTDMQYTLAADIWAFGPSTVYFLLLGLLL